MRNHNDFSAVDVLFVTPDMLVANTQSSDSTEASGQCRTAKESGDRTYQEKRSSSGNQCGYDTAKIPENASQACASAASRTDVSPIVISDSNSGSFRRRDITTEI